MATRVLIVEDELPLLRNLSSYLGSFQFEFEVLVASSAEEALSVVKNQDDLDIMLTDIRLPGMDGIELVKLANRQNPGLSILVMTAFPSAHVRKSATAAGAIRYMEKPLDMKELRKVLLEVVERRAGWSGSVVGLDLFDFTQLFLLSGKSKAIRVHCGRQHGVLIFSSGSLVHASTGDSRGDDAFFTMATWAGGNFEELDDGARASHRPNISSSTNHLMMEAARLRDEKNRTSDSDDDLLDDVFSAEGETEISAVLAASIQETNVQPNNEEDIIMAIKDHLADFEDIEGFKGVAVFTSTGEMLESLSKGKTDIKTVGMFANNALLNAQKATDQMGVGRGNLVQIRAPQAIVLMRCLNEATDFAASKEGKAHFHTVVVLDTEANVGMASMVLDRIQDKIAAEMR